jgi:hypothetical protein
MIPLPESHKSNKQKDCDDASKRLGVLLAVLAPAVRELDGELARVLDIWAGLSSRQRRHILVQVDECPQS